MPSFKTSWQSGQSYCKSKHGDLASFANKAEQDAATRYSYASTFWIGLTDSRQEGRWEWSDSSTVTWTNWASREPNGRRSENCGYVIKRDGKWNDIRCDYNLNFMCKIPRKYIILHFCTVLAMSSN